MEMDTEGDKPTTDSPKILPDLMGWKKKNKLSSKENMYTWEPDRYIDLCKV